MINVNINIYFICNDSRAFDTFGCNVMGFHDMTEDKCLKGNVYRRYDLSMHVFISSAGPSGSRTLMYMSDICGSHSPGCVLFLLVFECR